MTHGSVAFVALRPVPLEALVDVIEDRTAAGRARRRRLASSLAFGAGQRLGPDRYRGLPSWSTGVARRPGPAAWSPEDLRSRGLLAELHPNERTSFFGRASEDLMTTFQNGANAVHAGYPYPYERGGSRSWRHAAATAAG